MEARFLSGISNRLMTWNLLPSLDQPVCTLRLNSASWPTASHRWRISIPEV
jgi:hypothetical protein